MTPKSNGKKEKKVMGTVTVNPTPKLAEVKTDEAKAAQLDPNKFVGRVSKKEDNPFTGTKIVYEGEYALDLASKFEDPEKGYDAALAMCGGNLKDLLFWFDHGRKTQARTQATLDLGLEFTSDKEDEEENKKEVDELDNLYRAFSNALDNMVTKDTPKEKRKRVIDFILGEDKFEPIRNKLNNIQDPEPKFTSFGANESKGEVKLKKPSGIKGRQKTVKTDESGTVVAETETEES